MKPAVSRTLFLALAAVSLTPEVLAAAPRYNMVLDASQAEHGVKTVSLVQNPAIQRNWVALAAVDAGPKRVHLSEGAKQVLTGPALVPGQQILRLDEAGNPFYIVFDEANIEATARQFAAQGCHNSTNQAHSIGLTGNVLYESWIVTDPSNDKAAALGLDVPAGTWMLSAHIPDATYWLSEVVSGNVRGFSIEGLFDSVQLNLSAEAPAPTTLMGYFEKLWAKLSALGKDKANEIRAALGLEQLADGRAVQIDDTTGAVCVCGPDGTAGEALPDGEYDLANGGKLVVQGGKRADGEQPAATGAAPADLATPPSPPAAKTDEPAAAAAPAPLPETAGLPDVVKAVNEILGLVKKDAPAANPATAPAAAKMAAQLHGVEVAKLGDLKLDAIELDGGDSLTLNPVSRKLTDSKGALVESGYYKAADGSYFQVSTDQYFWSIDKQTYDAVYSAKLQAIELAEVKAKLATQPAGTKLHLSGEAAGAGADTNTVQSRAQLRLQRAEATR